MIKLEMIDHHAPVGERERFLVDIRSRRHERYLLLETCDRVELYTDDHAATFDFKELCAIAEHLFRVAAGLESPMRGEHQIFHQVKQAYRVAVSRGELSMPLHLLFQNAHRVSKRVRSVTGIGRGAVSHAHGAFSIITGSFDSLSDKRIAVIGVSGISRTLLRFMKRRGAAFVFLGNRTYQKARSLADEFGWGAFPLDSKKDVLSETDILVSATSAPHLVVHADDLPAGKKMLIIDCAVPRDVDPALGDREGITLMNVDDIERHCAASIRHRHDEAIAAGRIIREEAEAVAAEIVARIDRQTESAV
jgi:glutamyl-tRNA reductase